MTNTRNRWALVLACLATLSVSTGAGAAGAAPVARLDAYLLRSGATIEVSAAAGVLANDISADRAHLVAALVVPPSHGVVTLRPDGSFRYRPTTGYEGMDSFGYRAIDGNGRSGMVAARFTVNRPPRAVADSYTTRPGTQLVVADPGVLANDVNILGRPLTSKILVGPAHGVATVGDFGRFVYRPAPGFTGTDTLTYRARDGYGAWSLPATVTIRVALPNRAPVGVADSYTMNEDDLLDVYEPGVLANDTDADGDTLTVEMVGFPSAGYVDLRSDGSFSAETAINGDADIAFRYRVSDGQTFSAPVEVYIDVIAQNDPPIAENDYWGATAGFRLYVDAPGVLANDSDPVEFDGLTARILTQPATGFVTMETNGSFTFDADGGLSRFDLFTYEACDGGGCAVGEVSLEIFGDDPWE